MCCISLLHIFLFFFVKKSTHVMDECLDATSPALGLHQNKENSWSRACVFGLFFVGLAFHGPMPLSPNPRETLIFETRDLNGGFPPLTLLIPRPCQPPGSAFFSHPGMG